MKLLGLFVSLILVIAIIPTIEAKELKTGTQNKVSKLEKKIDVFLVMCKQVGKIGVYDFCYKEGVKILKDRNYKHVNPSYKVLLESKLASYTR